MCFTILVALTAATDSLSVDVQTQLLNILGYPGMLWKLVLDRQICDVDLTNQVSPHSNEPAQSRS